jgi:hypothetical protein
MIAKAFPLIRRFSYMKGKSFAITGAASAGSAPHEGGACSGAPVFP